MLLGVMYFYVYLFVVIKTGHSLDTNFDEDYNNFIKYYVCPISDENHHFSIIQAQMRNARVLSTIAAKNRQIKQAIGEPESTKQSCELLQKNHQEEKNSTKKTIENLQKKHDKEMSDLISKTTKEISEIQSYNRQEIIVWQKKLVMERIATESIKAELENMRRFLKNRAEINLKCLSQKPKTDKIKDLFEASRNGRIEKVKELLEGCQYSNAIWIDNSNNALEDSPLTTAANKRHLDIVSILIEYGANVNYANKYKNTALIIASRWGYIEIVELLLKNGAKVNDQDNRGRTAISYAAHNARIDVIKALIYANADINIKNDNGESPLIWAPCNYGYYYSNAQNKISEVITLLLEYGAKINDRDNKGRTAIWEAAHFGEIEVVKTLIDAKADINMKDVYGISPLIGTLRYGHANSANQTRIVEVVKLLLKNGAKIDDQDDDGKTTIWWAAYKAKVDAIKILLENGADPNIKDNKRKSPLEMVGKWPEVNKSDIPKAVTLLKFATST